MGEFTGPNLSRRRLLAGAALAGVASVLPRWSRAAVPAVHRHRLTVAPSRVRLVPEPHPETAVWAYAGTVPGPLIRLRQGDRLEVRVENRLTEPTTVHWHGIRVPNAMDGVPHLTQAPIEPGEFFDYAFDCPDAGTFWYHPHQRGHEQIGRGLAGVVVVDEPEPPAVDRDLVWVLDDWRLTAGAAISDDFGHMHDVSHAGRIGNTVTLNGEIAEALTVRRGERLRLRLVNVANARIFGLEFAGHQPLVIAWDGQPVEPHAPAGGRVRLGPGMRADLIVDMIGPPGGRFTITDTFYQDREYRLLDLDYGPEPLREAPPDTAVRLPANPLPEPDPNDAIRHEIVFGGGMMGGLTAAMLDGHSHSMGELLRRGMAWAVNGVVADGHSHEPMLHMTLGRTHVLDLHNDTAWHHPIHLHGHAFRVISRNGRPTRYREWQDTVLLNPRERAELALVADNPGDWMLHCHILEHQAGGMTGLIRVG